MMVALEELTDRAEGAGGMREVGEMALYVVWL